jgi:preprotein translocase subunit SecA
VGPRRAAAGGLRDRAARRPPRAQHAPLRRAAHRRHGAAPRLHRRDEDRRGQDPRRHAALRTSTRSRARACTSSRSTTTSPRATPSGWAALPLPRALTVGVVVNQENDREKQAAYRADITYGQNNEFGFDYLRDNMKFSRYEYAQRELQLRDRRRGRLDPHRRGAHAAHHLGQGERERQVRRDQRDHPVAAQGRALRRRREGPLGHAHRRGHREAERLLASGSIKGKNLYDPANIETLHILNQCLRAHTLYKRDVNYMVREGKVLIVDEFTGRVLAGRRWSDGLHQAVEAKENVRIQEENRTLATITFQNLFRIYKKLGGDDRHGRHRGRGVPQDLQARRRHPDQQEDHPQGLRRPRLQDRAREVHRGRRGDHGEATRRAAGPRGHDERREEPRRSRSSQAKKGIKHEVLNAKQHEREAYVVAQAGARARSRLDQHGRPRHGHLARRQPRDAREARDKEQKPP